MTSYSIDKSVLTKFHNQHVSNGIKVFYAEAGSVDKPTLVLLHGFPTSSRMFREFIVLVAPYFHIIAPDLPGFGLTKLPKDAKVNFEVMTETIDLLLSALNVQKFSIYVFDYGAPTGFKLALKRPNDIQGIITQNGNAYKEGLGKDFWGPLMQTLWPLEDMKRLTGEEQKTYDTTYETMKGLIVNIEGYDFQYYDGEKDLSRINPELPEIDKFLLNNAEGAVKRQMDLLLDYRHNLTLYPKFQEYFKKSNVPILAVWGVNDTIFVKEGQAAFARDSTNVKLVDIDGGHFSINSHTAEIAQAIVTFFHDYGII